MHGDLEAFPRCNKIYRRREEKKEGKTEKEKERTAKFESFGFVHRPSIDWSGMEDRRNNAAAARGMLIVVFFFFVREGARVLLAKGRRTDWIVSL